MYQHFTFQGPPNVTPIGIFGLKTNHLATLLLSLLRWLCMITKNGSTRLFQTVPVKNDFYYKNGVQKVWVFFSS
jgi:hypothetical protein